MGQTQVTGTPLDLANQLDTLNQQAATTIAQLKAMLTAQPSCTLMLNPTSFSAPSAASSFSVAITATGGCVFNATSNAAWLTVTSVSATSLSLQTTDNANASARTATVRIGTQTLSITQAAPGTTYNVGPGRDYTNLGDVPWYKLTAGDTVYIYARPTPYTEKILIGGQGTADHWIRIIGVPDANGNKPVISGNGATTSTNNHYHWTAPTGSTAIQWNGIIQVAPNAESYGAGLAPAYVEIANLEIRDSGTAYSFTAENGTTGAYAAFSACIYARSVAHMFVHDNTLHNCGLGFYNWIGTGQGAASWDGLQVDTVLRNNYFYDNGVAGGYTEHQSYTESKGVTIEGNYFGTPKSGMLGNQIKDRSAGTIIRYNHVEQSPAGYDFDLVEPQNSYPALGSLDTYKQAFVYGNIIVNNRATNQPEIVHWNEDDGLGHGRANITGGKLLYYHNTFVEFADAYKARMFNTHLGGGSCPTSVLPGVIDARNNIWYVAAATAAGPATQLLLEKCQTENATFGVNWLTPGWAVVDWTGTTAGGTITGTGNFLTPGNATIAFDSANPLHLLSTSSAAAVAGTLAPEVTSNYLGLNLTPNLEYVYELLTKARTSLADLGAFGR